MRDPLKITYCTYFKPKNAVDNEPTLFIFQLDSRVKLVKIDVSHLIKPGVRRTVPQRQKLPTAPLPGPRAFINGGAPPYRIRRLSVNLQ